MPTTQAKVEAHIRGLFPELYKTVQIPCPEGRLGCLVFHTKNEPLPITLAHYLRALVSTEYERVYTRAIDQDGYLMEYDPYEQINPWSNHYSNLKFNLTTQAPDTEEDWTKLAKILGVNLE